MFSYQEYSHNVLPNSDEPKNHLENTDFWEQFGTNMGLNTQAKRGTHVTILIAL